MWLVWCMCILLVARSQDSYNPHNPDPQDALRLRVHAEIQRMDAFRAQVRTLEVIPLLALCQVWEAKTAEGLDVLREEGASPNLLATVIRAQTRLERSCAQRLTELTSPAPSELVSLF